MKVNVYFLCLILFFNLSFCKKYKLRKYNHVKKFYKQITLPTIKICMENNIPPAAILGIAGLESGYGNGYVAQITGNILSLGAGKGEITLKSLYLPNFVGSNEVIIDTSLVRKYPKKTIEWKKRPPSYKKDYRPRKYAGTSNNLIYFKNHPKEKLKANIQCVKDFVYGWMGRSHKKSAFKIAKDKMNQLVKENGKKILISDSTAIAFADLIGGIQNSFNYRKTWPEKIKKIINLVGLNQLVYDIYYNKIDFETAWSNKL